MRICLCLLTALALCLPAAAQDNPDDAAEPEGKVRLTLETGGHTSVIEKVLFTPDSTQLITLAKDQSIRVWDIETGDCVNVLYPPLHIQPGSARLSPDGRRLAVSRFVNDKGKTTFSLLLIALPEGRIERVLAGDFPGALVLAFAPDGKRLASVSGKTVFLWNLDQEGAAPQKTFATPGAAHGIAFSPDGKRLAQSGEWSGILDVDAGRVAHKFPAGTAGDRVAWSPDGKTVAFATGQGLRLYDPDGKQPRLVLEDKVKITSASFSAAFQAVLATEGSPPAGSDHVRATLYGSGGRVRKTFVDDALVGHKPAGGKPRAEDPAHPLDERFIDGALSPDGKLAAAVGRLAGHHQVLVWRTSDGKLVQRLTSRAWISVPDATIGWSPKGNTLIWTSPRHIERGFMLGDTALAEGLRFIAKPPAPAPALVTEQGGLRLVPPNGEKTAPIFKGNQTKAHTTITTPHPLWHATFFGKNEVALHGRPFAIVDANTGKQVRKLQGHSTYVLNIACSPNHKYLASASWDQVICVHAVGQTEPLFSLYVAPPDWVVWTPEGYYAASPGGERLMGWVVETSPDEMSTFHPASRFHPRLYRPDVIRLLLKEGSVAAALKVADAAAGNKESKTVKLTDLLPPEVKIINPPPGRALKAGKLKIEAEARAAGEDPITALQLLIDERPYGGEKGLVALAKPDKGPVKASWDVDLPPGSHSIRVLARTAASLGTSRGMVRDTDDDQPAPKKKEPALYVLSVGINNYKAMPVLGGAVNDANGFEEVLQKHSKPLFSKYETKFVLDKEATRAGILKGLDWLQERQTASDVAVIYFAGHGDLDHQSKEFYLLPQDTDPKDLARTALSRAELKKRMQALPGRVVVVLDACHTGAVGLLFDDVSRELVDEDCGVVVICAASPKETAKEKVHGFLTLALMDALSGKVQTRDGRVYLHHLPPYLIDQVEEMSKDQQHPVVVVPPWLHSFYLSKP